MTKTDMDNIELRKPEAFDERFNEYLSESSTYKEAYLKTEEDHISIFGEAHYVDYESYRLSRRKRTNKCKSA